MADDFGYLKESVNTDSHGIVKDNDKGEKRTYLRVYETLPPQLLNAYGPSKFQKMSDDAVWTAMSAPLKTGALYMSELCSKDVERRGVGMNRQYSRGSCYHNHVRISLCC